MAANPSGTEQLIAWLDDAHAMETGLISILQTHASHFAQPLPHAGRLEEHVVQTQQHVQRLRECLRRLNPTPSGVKSTLSSAIGSIEGATTTISRDQLVKDALADYASEQFEIACYTALISAATHLGYADVASLCQQNLDEDQQMAAWLLQQIPSVAFRDVIHAAAASTRR